MSSESQEAWGSGGESSTAEGTMGTRVEIACAESGFDSKFYNRRKLSLIASALVPHRWATSGRCRIYLAGHKSHDLSCAAI